jgi:hypothetical protein
MAIEPEESDLRFFMGEELIARNNRPTWLVPFSALGPGAHEIGGRGETVVKLSRSKQSGGQPEVCSVCI